MLGDSDCNRPNVWRAYFSQPNVTNVSWQFNSIQLKFLLLSVITQYCIVWKARINFPYVVVSFYSFSSPLPSSCWPALPATANPMMNHWHFDLAHPSPGRHGTINAYLDLHMGHEHGEAGEVCAGAAGVCAIGGQQTTVLCRPESRHGALGIAPEWAVGIEVCFRMLRARGGGTKRESERTGEDEEMETGTKRRRVAGTGRWSTHA